MIEKIVIRKILDSFRLQTEKHIKEYLVGKIAALSYAKLISKNTSKYVSNFQIPYYHPINYELLGVSIGNQGQPMMDFQSSETILNQ